MQPAMRMVAAADVLKDPQSGLSSVIIHALATSEPSVAGAPSLHPTELPLLPYNCSRREDWRLYVQGFRLIPQRNQTTLSRYLFHDALLWVLWVKFPMKRYPRGINLTVRIGPGGDPYQLVLLPGDRAGGPVLKA